MDEKQNNLIFDQPSEHVIRYICSTVPSHGGFINAHDFDFNPSSDDKRIKYVLNVGAALLTDLRHICN